MVKTKVINIFGAPNEGKTTAAAGLFYRLKKLGYSADMPYEYPKSLVWLGEGRIQDQFLVFAEQHHHLFKRWGKVEYIIMDSPILMSIVYARAFGTNSQIVKMGLWDEKMDMVATHLHNSYESLNYLLIYKGVGRKRYENGDLERFAEVEQSLDLCKEIKGVLEKQGVFYTEINRRDAVDTIIGDLCAT